MRSLRKANEMAELLALPAGLKIVSPNEMLMRFLKNEWQIYDGQPNAQDSTLSLFDILISVSMNSRLDTADKVRSVWEGRHAVEEALKGVPVDIALVDKDVPWNELQTLFKVFCDIPYAKEAVASKILHRKRPSLIPIIDSVIGKYLNEVRGHPAPGCISERIIDQIKVFRSVLMEFLPQVSKLSAFASDQGYPISRVRTLEILIWVSSERNEYYRKQAEGETDA